MNYKPFLFCISLFISNSLFAFQPFFDNNPQTRYAPPDPQLTDFDLEVLELCGKWGAKVNALDFEKMMLNNNSAPALAYIKNSLGNRIFRKAKTNKDFVQQLRRVWFEQKGFKHVFCGEPSLNNGLGGLHYAPRYWQAQDEKWAGHRALIRDFKKRPLKACRQYYIKENIKPPIYTIGLEYKNPRNNRTQVKCLSGYHYKMSAQDILIAGTKAFKQANKKVGKNAKAACLFKTQGSKAASHYSTLVIKSRALRTFYPMADKKPYCKKDKRNISACFCSKL